ncbi:hypothetical protein ACFVZ3_06355 [Kitasatospora purpeofusca]|uniref:hypothetical protein n=1 Tax=Kitasatospora purpeofusca TaxID=67352 RepID=UPI00369A573C
MPTPGTRNRSLRLPHSQQGQRRPPLHIADLAAWLGDQGTGATFDFPEPRGSAILTHLHDGRRLLIHLDKIRPVEWDDTQATEIPLGPGVVMPPDRLAARSHVHRIRYETDGDGRRRLTIGSQTPAHHVARPARLGSHHAGTQGFAPADRTEEVLSAQATPAPRAAPEHLEQQRSIVALNRPASGSAFQARRTDVVLTTIAHLDRALREENWRWIRAAVAAVEEQLTQPHSKNAVRRLRWAPGRRCGGGPAG